MSDELLEGYGSDWSLGELRRRGMAGRSGLDDMLRRLRSRRRGLADELNLSGPLQEIRRELDEILELERKALAGDESDSARLNEAMLDALSGHPSRMIRELTTYEFASTDARARFNNLVEKLRREVLNSYFRDIAGAMREISPEDIARIKDMLAELNDMIEADRRGDDYDFKGFMSRYGDFFPENPTTLQELLEIMARRMAAMSRLLAGLSPGQQRELAELAESVMEDLDLQWQMDRLGSNLRSVMPELPWDEATPSFGEGDMPMSAAVDAIERLGETEELEGALAGDYPGATIEDVDEEELRKALGDQAVADLRWLKQIERALEDAGVVRRSAGALELTARGARLIGERSLTRLLDRIRREPS
ncbi:MAG: hypothetical protein ACREX8_16590, partial [Gammaproteobacteria bacterium]